MGETKPSNPGTAGHSAKREADRLQERFQQEGASRSRLLNALLGPSARQKRLAAQEKRWATGARGEELLAEVLARKCPEVALLHDRRMPASRANIDHLAVASTGVYVIDAKRYRGRIEVRSPMFGKSKLVIAGRDRTKLATGLEKQVDAVTTALAAIEPGVPVFGCLCFVAPVGFLADVGLPTIRTLKINGFPLYYTGRLAKKLNRPGAVSREQTERICQELAQRFPPA
jgi:hypothetical protein